MKKKRKEQTDNTLSASFLKTKTFGSERFYYHKLKRSDFRHVYKLIYDKTSEYKYINYKLIQKKTPT